MILIKYIGHSIRTATGFYQKNFSEKWDVLLNELLSDGEIVQLSIHTISIKKDNKIYSIWHSNKYYCYAYFYENDGFGIDDNLQFRPRFKTMLRLESFVLNLQQIKANKDIKKIYG
jgi:hypothetical protein